MEARKLFGKKCSVPQLRGGERSGCNCLWLDSAFFGCNTALEDLDQDLPLAAGSVQPFLFVCAGMPQNDTAVASFLGHQGQNDAWTKTVNRNSSSSYSVTDARRIVEAQHKIVA